MHEVDKTKAIIVAVGSKNPVKLNAALNGFKHYFENVHVDGFNVPSGVRDQPKSLEEMSTGAATRAKNAYAAGKVNGHVDYGVGIEAGVYSVPGFPHKHFTGAISAVFDGKSVHLGLSTGVELPPKVAKIVIETDKELGTVFDELLDRKNVKQQEGAVGVLTKGKFPREKTLEFGVALALVPIVSKELFE